MARRGEVVHDDGRAARSAEPFERRQEVPYNFLYLLVHLLGAQRQKIADQQWPNLTQLLCDKDHVRLVSVQATFRVKQLLRDGVERPHVHISSKSPARGLHL